MLHSICLAAFLALPVVQQGCAEPADASASSQQGEYGLDSHDEAEEEWVPPVEPPSETELLQQAWRERPAFDYFWRPGDMDDDAFNPKYSDFIKPVSIDHSDGVPCSLIDSHYYFIQRAPEEGEGPDPVSELRRFIFYYRKLTKDSVPEPPHCDAVRESIDMARRPDDEKISIASNFFKYSLDDFECDAWWLVQKCEGAADWLAAFQAKRDQLNLS